MWICSGILRKEAKLAHSGADILKSYRVAVRRQLGQVNKGLHWNYFWLSISSGLSLFLVLVQLYWCHNYTIWVGTSVEFGIYSGLVLSLWLSSMVWPGISYFKTCCACFFFAILSEEHVQVWDLIKLGDYLSAMDDVDPCRIGITGESLRGIIDHDCIMILN